MQNQKILGTGLEKYEQKSPKFFGSVLYKTIYKKIMRIIFSKHKINIKNILKKHKSFEELCRVVLVDAKLSSLLMKFFYKIMEITTLYSMVFRKF